MNALCMSRNAERDGATTSVRQARRIGPVVLQVNYGHRRYSRMDLERLFKMRGIALAGTTAATEQNKRGRPALSPRGSRPASFLKFEPTKLRLGLELSRVWARAKKKAASEGKGEGRSGHQSQNL